MTLCFLVAALALPASPKKESTPLVIEHVTVIDCTGAKPRTDMDVVVENGRIGKVGPAKGFQIPGGAQELQASGKYLIPGLWDMHVHGTAIPGFLGIYLANGVTGVRDMFDPSDSTFKLRKSVAEGSVLGPHILAAGKIVDGPKPIWPGSLVASNGEEGRAAVGKALTQGSDFIKVYSLLPKDAFMAIADECKKRHVVFAGHVPESVSAWEASDAGQKSMEHLYGILRACSANEGGPNRVNLLELDPKEVAPTIKNWLSSFDENKAQKLYAKLKKNGSYQCPTFTVLYSMSHPKDPRTDIQSRFDYLPFWMRNIWKTPNPRVAKRTAEDEAVQDELFKKNLQMVGEMSRAGVPILAGTDVMNPYCFPGFSLHDELAWLVKAGLTPMQALRSATYIPSVYLGIQKDYGTVQAGKVADLVLLDDNPLVDIHNTTKIDAVIYGGKLLDRPALDKIMPKGKSTAMVAPPYAIGFADGRDD